MSVAAQAAKPNKFAVETFSRTAMHVRKQESRRCLGGFFASFFTSGGDCLAVLEESVVEVAKRRKSPCSKGLRAMMCRIASYGDYHLCAMLRGCMI
jgi:hypothetical protein